MSERRINGTRQPDPAILAARQILGTVREDAVQGIVRAARQAALTAQASTGEMIAATAALLAETLIQEDEPGLLLRAHNAMTQSAMVRLRPPEPMPEAKPGNA
jgi:hypothetical protein